MKIITLPVSDLHPADYNPRKDLAPGDKQYEKLARSIETFGYVEPIVWNRTTGNIVGGHQRLKVLVQNGYTEVQVVEVELNEQEERMAIEWKKNDLPTLAQKVADDASETCQNFIYAGIDVELSGGTQHFSLMPNDQTNIDSMFAAITLGASEYPYHPDGGKCVMYSAADIITLYSEYKSFVTKQTTYCNALRQWAKRETDPNVIGSIYYGCTLPEDLEKEVGDILSAAQAQITAIINKLSA